MAAAGPAEPIQPAGMATTRAATAAGEHGDADATHAGEYAIRGHGNAAGPGIWPTAESRGDGHGNAHGVPFLTVRGEQA